jgi:hypothetical protein
VTVLALNPPLTDNQRRQIRALAAAEAVSAASAASIYDLQRTYGSPLVLGALRERGLASSRVVRPGQAGANGQFTAYWLTPAGVAAAKTLAVAS